MADQSRAGFEAVFESHFKDVYGYVAFRVAPRLDDARDLTQEVFLAAFKAWKSYRGDAAPLQWLRMIARNKVADYYRRSRPTVSVEDVSLPAEAPADGDYLDETLLLSMVMRSMPPEYAEIIEQKYLEGMSVREIGLKCGRSEKAVQAILARARAMLREKCMRLKAKQESCRGSR